MDVASTSSEGSYCVDLFTFETWGEFLAAGGNVSGFSPAGWTAVQKMKAGDVLV